MAIAGMVQALTKRSELVYRYHSHGAKQAAGVLTAAGEPKLIKALAQHDTMVRPGSEQ